MECGRVRPWRGVHRALAPWPDSAAVHAISEGASERIIPATAAALQAIRKVKSEAQVSQKAELTELTLEAPAADVAEIENALADLTIASRVTGTLDVVAGGDETTVIAHTFA